MVTAFLIVKLSVCHEYENTLKIGIERGTWLAQSEEHGTLDLGVVSLSPTSGVEITKKKKNT